MTKKRPDVKRETLRTVEGEASGGRRLANRQDRADRALDKAFSGDGDSFEEGLREYCAATSAPRLGEAGDQAEPEPEPENLAGGSWFPIQFTPDPDGGEAINIGVGYLSPTGRVSVKLLEAFGRLHWLYRDEWSMRDMGYLLRDVRRSFRNHGEGGSLPISPSRHIIYGAPKLVKGADGDSGLDALYQKRVMLARCGDLGPDD